MIKFTATQENGKQLLCVCIDANNLKALQDGKPIVVDGTDFGVDFDICIDFKPTMRDHIVALKRIFGDLPAPKIGTPHPLVVKEKGVH
jgi:hypothetical protein